MEHLPNFPIETTRLVKVCTTRRKVAECAHVQLFYTPLWFARIDTEKPTQIADLLLLSKNENECQSSAEARSEQKTPLMRMPADAEF